MRNKMVLLPSNFRLYAILCCLFVFRQAAWSQQGQISLPRVERMPNQPSPYDMRDWKTAAMRYDSFVYDWKKTGQHLPLISFGPAGTNYPQRETFRLHTYVGTKSPLGNEAINVLPSLVGASLVGINKSEQFGKNWVLLSQDFYNKANGENLYLNNASSSSGQDWWYDMMPNVFFYQLYDLYPNIGGEAQAQFNTIAGRMAAAVRAMGGNDAPWQVPFMNYRGWRFKTGTPNATGVPEPEAAGAFGWLLYSAWKKTGNPEYLKAAEWSLEFLNEWTSNPSYELQLPYGILAAARMNAEEGTNYDLPKMVNWAFDRGALRGWGAIVGNWGNISVSGLIGEANDNGNDYAFQLNGVQQAAALVPMVRYDKRFARGIGKWMLNLANATRLFFPNFLPSSLQDGTAWSSANDPQGAIGYEALRQVWQGISPFATGDALRGGWAATNLSLYSTSSLGYLGALVEKTDVDKILKINVLATDFYRGSAYPTFLYYNSYSIAQNVELDAGNTPSDIYEALSEKFILKNVSGKVKLSIPANEAILVTLCPAGGTLTYDKNKMLVNGVVVDFRQQSVPFTCPPRIKGLAALKSPVEIGDSTAVYVTASDLDSPQLQFQWSASAGSISGNGAIVRFTAPSGAGNVQIRCIASDPEGKRDTATFMLPVVLKINDPPQINEVLKDKSHAAPGEVLLFTCLATDPDNDTLTYQWSASSGFFSGSGKSVRWTAPSTEGIAEITVRALDPGGLSAESRIKVLIKVFDPAARGKIIADYPFSGNTFDVSGNQLHGISFGAIPNTDRFGQAQSAYYFNGGAQHISVANNALLNFQDGITISCWLNARALPDKETFLLSHGSWQNRWKLSITPDRKLRWTVNTFSAIADLDALVSLKTDTFYHVAATYSEGLMALYLNGELHHFRPMSGKMRTTSAAFLVGQMLPGDNAYNFKGVIDEVKIYDYALTPDAVKLLAGQGATSTRSLVRPELQELVIFPNPGAGLITVKAPIAIEQVKVFDTSGKLVTEISCGNTAQAALDLGNVPPGIYQIIGIGPQGSVCGRFVRI
ncbi:MAG: LamG-like jellyroll fold domain-containing protein [Saprospiraceae bacterium]